MNLGEKRTIMMVTGNKHKVEEVSRVAGEYGITIEMRPHMKLEIQSDDLMEIAEYAALNAYIKIKKPILVEDAGLFIQALNGFPGPYSSYVFKKIGYEGILKMMSDTTDRRAHFKSAAVIIHEPCIIKSTGEVHGEITLEPHGENGFGFDPIFRPEGSGKTFGEMDISEKNRYSHRAKAAREAFRRLLQCLSAAKEPP